MGAVALQIWDTAGQERFRSLVPIYSRNASALVVVFDASSAASFEEAKEWALKFRNADAAAGQRVYFVGNKVDLPAALDLEAGAAFAERMGARFFRTSAATGYGVPALFEAIAADVSARQRPQAAAREGPAPAAAVDPPDPGCC
jgi:Ras-related protein Rab-5C